MTIPPHRAAGELGHIEDHNAIVDVLTGNDTDIAAVTQGLADHIAGEDPHGDRAWATGEFAPINHTHDFPVDSVNGATGDVILDADDVGAATPSSVSSAVADLQAYVEGNFVNIDEKGATDGVAPLNSSGLIDLEYLPGFGGASRVTVDEVPPSSPNVGDVWINTTETLPEPSPIMPTFTETKYTGPRYYLHSEIPTPAGQFHPFPGTDFEAVTFTTGPTGRTSISLVLSAINGASDESTVSLSYSLLGDGVSLAAAFTHGAYQPPRGFQSAAFFRSSSIHVHHLPPDTEVTLTPAFRLSSIPTQANQDGTNNALRFAIEETFDNNIQIECW